MVTWKRFPCYCPFVRERTDHRTLVREIHRSPMDSPHTRPVIRSFDVSYMCTIRLKKILHSLVEGDFETSWRPYDIIVHVGALEIGNYVVCIREVCGQNSENGLRIYWQAIRIVNITQHPSQCFDEVGTTRMQQFRGLTSIDAFQGLQ